MLVLSRNSNEVVHIGPNVRVRVLSIQRRRVRLGIEALGVFQSCATKSSPNQSNAVRARKKSPLLSRLGSVLYSSCRGQSGSCPSDQ